jgi:SAM-dependent methyltransferase
VTEQRGGYADQSFIAEYYDAVYRPGPVDDVPFWVDRALKSGGPVLELGCGTGRVLIPTARAGCRITGLDYSRYMLDKCREKLSKESHEVQQRVNLLSDDMTRFDTGEKYALITLPSRSFELLVSVEDQLSCLRCVSQHLEPEGRFIVDFFSPIPMPSAHPADSKAPEHPPEAVMPDGRKVVRANRIAHRHPERQYNDIEILYIVTYPDGRTESMVQTFSFRTFYRYEVEHLLALAGLKVTGLLGNFDGSPYTAGSPEMIFIAGKQ